MARKKWAGARWYIGTKTAALASETNWTAIEGARAASGSFGKEWQTADATTMADHFRRNAKTIFDAGQIELTMLRNMADPGQAALKSACNDKTDTPFNFKVELDDNPDPSPGDGNPSTFRFRAQVHAFSGRAGGPTNLVEFMARLDLEDELLEEDADTGV